MTIHEILVTRVRGRWFETEDIGPSWLRCRIAGVYGIASLNILQLSVYILAQ
jgi:hypothetical protein